MGTLSDPYTVGNTSTVALDTKVAKPLGQGDKISLTVTLGDAADAPHATYEYEAAAAGEWPAEVPLKQGETALDGVKVEVKDGNIVVTYEPTPDADATDAEIITPTITGTVTATPAAGAQTQTLDNTTTWTVEDIEQVDSIATFEQTSDDAEEFSEDATTAKVTFASDLDEGKVLANEYTATSKAALPAPTAATDKLTVTINGVDYVAGAKDDGGDFVWDNTTWEPTLVDTGITITLPANAGDPLTVTIDETKFVDKAVPEISAKINDAAVEMNNPEGPAADETTYMQNVLFVDSDGNPVEPQDGDTLSIDYDGKTYTAEYKAVLANTDFEDADGGKLSDVAGAPTVAVKVPAAASTDPYALQFTGAQGAEAFTAIANAVCYAPDEAEEIQPDEADRLPYSNTGRDIIVLDGDFGNDVVVDFQTGVDQVDVANLLSSFKKAVDSSKLDNGQATVFTGNTEAEDGIFTDADVKKLVVTDKTIEFTGESGNAVVLLEDLADAARETNVYTAVVLSKGGAYSIMGSLTLAEGEEINSTDLVGVDQLLDDPSLPA